MLNWLVYGLAPAAAIILGAWSLARRRKEVQSRRRLGRHGRVALGAFGSAAIIWSVYLLGEFVNLLVIAVAITWLSRRLARESGNDSLALRLLLK